MKNKLRERKFYKKEDVIIKELPSKHTKNLTGKKFNKWNIIDYAGLNKDKKTLWWSWCNCSSEKIYLNVGIEMSRNRTKSCGCNIIESNKNRSFLKEKCIKLGLTEEEYISLRHVLVGMKHRCYNPENKDFKHYGLREITIYEEWLNFPDKFVEWGINNGYKKGLTIERNNVNEGYCPENCSWITMFEQANNKTTTIYIDCNNEKMTFMDLMRKLNINEKESQNIIRERYVRYKWSLKDSLKGFV